MTVPDGSSSAAATPARRGRGSSAARSRRARSSGSSLTAASSASRCSVDEELPPRGTGPRPPRLLRRRRAARAAPGGLRSGAGCGPRSRRSAAARLERRARAEAAERAARLDETVLGGLLCVGRVAGEHVGNAERDALVCVHELLIGVCVTALCALDQVLFVEWSAHHRRFYTESAAEVPLGAASTRPSRGKRGTRTAPPLT